MNLKYIFYLLTLLSNFSFGLCVGNSDKSPTVVSGEILSNITLSYDRYSCNKTTGEKEFVPCAANRLTCGQCTYFKQCIDGKYSVYACPKKEYMVQEGYFVWSNQFFDPITNECTDYVRSPVKGRCDTFKECRIINTDIEINPIVNRYEYVSKIKCPPDASQFDPISLQCTNQTTSCISKICTIRTCANGGICREKGNGEYSCLCPKGFVGRHCEVERNKCTLETCKNGGTCYSHSTRKTKCYCPKGFEGQNCETIKDFNLVKTLANHTRLIRSVAFRNDNMLASGSFDDTIKLWNTTTGKLLGTLNHKDDVMSVAFNDNNILASGSYYSTIKLWNTTTEKMLQTFTDHGSLIYSVAFGKNNLLASASADMNIMLWNTTTMTIIRVIVYDYGQHVITVALDSNNLLATGSNKGTLKLWDTNTGDLVRTLGGHTGTIRSVAFDSNNMLASGSDDKTIKLWNTATGSLIRTLYGHKNWVLSIAFGKNNLLASGCEDSTIKIWNSNTGNLVTTLTGHAQPVNSIAFDSNNMLASGSDDMTIKLWSN